MLMADEGTVAPDPEVETFNTPVSVCGLLMAPDDTTSIEP
jgi:hypothetical protein